MAEPTVGDAETDRVGVTLEIGTVADGAEDTSLELTADGHDQLVDADIDHDAPFAERTPADVLSLPVHPGLSADDIDCIAEVIDDYAA